METPPRWFSRSVEAVTRQIASIEPPLSDRLSRVFARLSRMNGGQSLLNSFCATASTPGVSLVDAFRDDVGMAPEDERMDGIGEGALFLYACVRVQDDIVDEPTLTDRGDVYAMELLSGASARAFASVVPESARFFAYRDDVMRSFAGASAWEADVYRKSLRGSPPPSYPGGDLEWLGQKFLPMAVPLGALAIVAGRAPDLARLTHFVTSLGDGLQMVNDALNVGEDHKAGRLTPVLSWLYEGGRTVEEDTPSRVRALLLSDAAFDRVLDFARRKFSEAERVAREAGAPAMAQVAREREAFVDSVPGRLFALAMHAGGLR